MNGLKRILLMEDNPKDVELTLAALDEHNLANEVVVNAMGLKGWIICICGGSFKCALTGILP